MKVYLTMIIVAIYSFNYSYAQDVETPCKCCSENYRLFDFWIGEWEVRDSTGNLLGHNSIELIQDSCALQENWESAKGYTGTSLSFYNQATKLWHQTWIDQAGGVILMNGEPLKDKMIMYTKKVPIKDSTTYFQNKTTWKPLTDGRVHHVWEQTKDGGNTWKVVFDGYYKRK